MFKLFSKKPTKPVIHLALSKNAFMMTDMAFTDLIEDDEDMAKFYEFHYNEELPTPAHLQFAQGIVRNLWINVKEELLTKYMEPFKVFTSTLEFSYTPSIDTGEVVVSIYLRSALTWRSSNHEEWKREKAAGY